MALLEVVDKEALQAGVEKFNEEPQKGIDFLLRSGVIAEQPEAIAAFLCCAEGLHRAGVGAYLGQSTSLNTQVLRAFMSRQNFHGLELDEGFRRILGLLSLPGEAQPIDRIVQSYAAKWSSDNSESPISPDCAYCVVFSCLMLNTEYLNPKIRKKMSVEEFCRGHRGINDGEDLPREYLEAMFARILGEPFDVTEPDGDPSGQPAEPRRCALGSGRCGLM